MEDFLWYENLFIIKQNSPARKSHVFQSYTCEAAQGCIWTCSNSSQCLYGGCTGNFMEFSPNFQDHLLMSVIDEYRVDSQNPNIAVPTKYKNIFNTSQAGIVHIVHAYRI